MITRRFDVDLAGSGWVLGVKFRPGGLSAMAGIGVRDLVLRIVEDMLADRSLLRVAQLEDRHGLSSRQVERLFAHYVGIGPKWMLARYRMHDAVQALDAGYDGTLADLAASCGWFDQAHFTRDFTALVGVTPSVYRPGVHRGTSAVWSRSGATGGA